MDDEEHFMSLHEPETLRLLYTLASKQKELLLDLFSKEQYKVILGCVSRFGIERLNEYGFFRDLGTTLNEKEIILDNLRNFKDELILDEEDIELLEAEKKGHL